MKVYFWDSETKELLEDGEAQLDPLESAKQGKAVYLMPANATDIEPLKIKNGFTQVWNGESWEYIEDHRDETIFNGVGYDKIRKIGKVPEGWVLCDDEMAGKLARREMYFENGKFVPATLEQRANEKRKFRDWAIKEIEWRPQRYEQQKKLGMETSDSEETYNNLIAYIQYLRDLPTVPGFAEMEIPTFEDYIAQK